MVNLSTTIRYPEDVLLLVGITTMFLGNRILPRLGYGNETVLNVSSIGGGLLLLAGVTAMVVGSR